MAITQLCPFGLPKIRDGCSISILAIMEIKTKVAG